MEYKETKLLILFSKIADIIEDKSIKGSVRGTDVRLLRQYIFEFTENPNSEISLEF